MPIPGSFVEPTPRRVRVRLGDRVVADSRRALLLVQYGPGGLPTYYLPLDDVRPGALGEPVTGPEGEQRWTVHAGPLSAVDAAWGHPAPTGAFADLAGYVTFSWRQLEWYEEDERVQMHARDPYKRVDTLHSSRHVRVRVDGEVVADSVRPLLLFETHLPTRYYLPFDDVRTHLLEASESVSVCPYKGRARYWSVRVGEVVVPDAVWSYPDPVPENPKIRDLLCFFTERVDLTLDGVDMGRPRSPWSDTDPTPEAGADDAHLRY